MKNTSLSLIKDYSAIDVFRFICSLFVIGIHFPPFTNITENLPFFFTQIVFRIAVPFFFICTGFFFANKINNKEKIKKYLLKITKFYLLYSITYFLQVAYTYIRSGDLPFTSFRNFFKNFFFVGYKQFWYLLAIIVAIIILVILIKYIKLSSKKIIATSIIIYSLGVIIYSYRSLFESIPTLSNILNMYQNIFNARNGIFFGFPFVTMGYYIYHYKPNISTSKNIGLILIFSILLTVEAFTVKKLLNVNVLDMTFMLMPLCIFIFLGILKIKLNISKSISILIRNLSLLIYGLHYFINFFLVRFIVDLPFLRINKFMHYLLCVCFSILFSYITLLLSKSKKLNFLKHFYQ